MKIIGTLLALAAFAFGCWAQTGMGTTNFSIAESDFREVNGNLYNASLDTNWCGVSGEIDAVSETGDVLVWSGEHHHYFILKNYAGEKADNLKIYSKAIYLGTNNWNGKYAGAYRIYDCGLSRKGATTKTNGISPARPNSPAPPPLSHPWES